MYVSLLRPAEPRALPRPGAGQGQGRGTSWWSRLPEGLGYSLLVYLATRLVVVAGVVAYLRRHPTDSLSRLSLKWDGWWYVKLAEQGYSTSLRSPSTGVRDWHHGYSDWAFFPGYPLLIRGAQRLTGAPSMVTAVVLAAVLGLVAVWAVYALGAEFGGPDVGRTAALLLAAWPGSAVFLQPYSEALFTAATAAALLALLRERWLVAGLLGAVSSATRPTGAALVAAAGAVAVVRLVRDRDPRPLLAPLLATTGAAGFAVHAWLRTGDVLAWRHAENLWAQKLDLSKKLLVTWVRVAADPEKFLRTDAGREVLAGSLLQVGGAAALVAVLVAVIRLRRRLTLPLAVYGGLTLFLVLAYSAVGPRPRTLLAVIPAFVWVAAWHPRGARVVAVAMTPLLAVVTYLWLWQVTP